MMHQVTDKDQNIVIIDVMKVITVITKVDSDMEFNHWSCSNDY